MSCSQASSNPSPYDAMKLGYIVIDESGYIVETFCESVCENKGVLTGVIMMFLTRNCNIAIIIEKEAHLKLYNSASKSPFIKQAEYKLEQSRITFVPAYRKTTLFEDRSTPFTPYHYQTVFDEDFSFFLHTGLY